MRKLPTCKNCGKVGHHTYQCWQKKTPTRKMLSKASKSRSKPLLAKKTYSATSSAKSSAIERKKLIKELDKYWSWYVRLEESDRNGIITCITCGKKLPYQLADNCHWISRRYQNTRWIRMNMHAGCAVCNRYKNGNYVAYNHKMKSLYGEDACQKLWDQAYSRRKIPTYELAEMLTDIKQQYKELINLRRSKGWKC